MIHINRRKPHSFRRLLSLLAWGSILSPAVAAAEAWVETGTRPVLIATAAPAQAASVAAAGSTSYRLNSEQGDAVSAVTPLDDSQALHIVVSLKLRHVDELDRRVGQAGAQPKPLTPAEFKDRYAPTAAQVQAVAAYLEKNGFVNVVVASNHRLISADGHASNVQTAFRAEMKRFVDQGREVYANASAAQVPASLGAVVESVLGLQNVSVPRVARRPAMQITQQPSGAPSSGH